MQTTTEKQAMESDRRWMYGDWNIKGPNANWCKKAHEFINHAFSHTNAHSHGVHCPCSKCGNFKKQDQNTISHHKNGFVPNYFVWTYHGETAHVPSNEVFDDTDHLNDMVHDLADADQIDSATNEAEQFFELLEASEQPVHKVGNSPISISTHTLFKLLFRCVFCKMFLHESCLKKSYCFIFEKN